MFMDTHTTGFYVNSYTTKMGVGMAEFMQHLRTGIERLQDQVAAEEAKMAAEAKALGRGPKSLGLARRAAKTLLRINTSYTAAIVILQKLRQRLSDGWRSQMSYPWVRKLSFRS